MTQPILVGLVAAIGSLAVAVLGLIGVLITTHVNYKLGRRKNDIEEMTAEDARMKQLSEENKGLRQEIRDLWTSDQDLRRRLAEREAEALSLNAQIEVALRAQERAEGALSGARRAIKEAVKQTIEEVCP